MPTVRGWLVGLTGAGLVVAGNLFGARPLQQMGFAFLILVGLAMGLVRLGRHDLHITRRLFPERTRPGQRVVLELEIINRGVGSALLLLVEDRVPSGLAGSARFALRGIEPQGSREATIELRAARRGRYEIGPLQVSMIDPFGLAQVRSSAVGRKAVLVQPRIERLGLPRDQGDRRSVATSTMRQPTGARGEDFYTLREYVEGDDLRKIHWPSTAKRARFMIRQEETPWQTKATVLLDDRRSVHDGFGDYSSFERSVEAAASIVDLYHRSGYSYRLLAAHAKGLPTGKGSDHYNRCLDSLATIRPGPGGESSDVMLARLAEIESASGAEAALVVVTGGLSAHEAMALAHVGRRFRQMTVLLFPGHRFSTQATKSRWEGEKHLVEVTRLVARSGARSIVLGPDESLGTGWSSLSRMRQRGATWGRRVELV